jgi:hypothetical protein
MLACRLPLILTGTLIVVTPACAQPREGPAYEASMKAAMSVMSFDALSAQCEERGGFGTDARATIKRWTAANGIVAARASVAQLRTDAVSAGHLAAGVKALTGMVAERGMNPCAAALALTGSNAATAPATPRALVNGGASPIAGQIDSFGFDTKPAMGVGGFITTSIYPVVLFKDGSALTDVIGLNNPAAHRRANPENWVQWRRSGGKIELMKSSSWQAMSFPRTYASLPAGFRLNGLFRRLSGSGNMGVGGSDSVTAVSEYRFWPDGAVVRGGSLGSTASSGDSSVVTSSVSPNARGQYRIDGLTLSIRYGDGTSERRILVADPANPKTAIWLDGYGYVRRGR